MKIYAKIATAFALATTLSLSVQAQKEKIYQLPTPEAFTSQRGGLLGGANDVGTIYYGSVPANAGAKPVIVFIHGYSSSAKSWWTNNDMYQKAFADGYRTAFVSVHPDKTMLVNGAMFAGMLNTIATNYGVSKVVVVAHSKGGMDSDAALILSNAYNRVDRVITLSTPHYGTPLADLAQSGWVSWLSGVFGQYNDATYSLQTGYASNFRTQIAADPDYRKANFHTFGASKYSGILWVSGVYLSWNGGGSGNGGNDGVVTYNSSKRPNAAVLFNPNDSRGQYNHFEVAEGQYMWNKIKSLLPASLAKTTQPTAIETPNDYNPNKVITSNSQVVVADKGIASFNIEKTATKIKVAIYQQNPNEITTITNNGRKYGNENWTITALENAGFISDYVKYIELDGNTGNFVIENPSKTPFLAVITVENGVEIRLETGLTDQKLVYEAGETINFGVNLSNDNNLSNMSVTATLMRVGNLEGNIANDDKAYAVTFKKENNKWMASIKENLAEGVYSVSLRAGNSEFSRTIVTSLAVTGKTITFVAPTTSEETMSAYPNPSAGKVNFTVKIEQEGNNSLSIYDITGKKVTSYDLSGYKAGFHTISWEAAQILQNGLYLYELNLDGKRTTKKFVLNR